MKKILTFLFWMSILFILTTSMAVSGIPPSGEEKSLEGLTLQTVVNPNDIMMTSLFAAEQAVVDNLPTEKDIIGLKIIFLDTNVVLANEVSVNTHLNTKPFDTDYVEVAVNPIISKFSNIERTVNIGEGGNLLIDNGEEGCNFYPTDGNVFITKNPTLGYGSEFTLIDAVGVIPTTSFLTSARSKPIRTGSDERNLITIMNGGGAPQPSSGMGAGSEVASEKANLHSGPFRPNQNQIQKGFVGPYSPSNTELFGGGTGEEMSVTA